jgi:hypothetical protein
MLLFGFYKSGGSPLSWLDFNVGSLLLVEDKGGLLEFNRFYKLKV